MFLVELKISLFLRCEMKVVEVNNHKLISDFLNFPKSLYKHDSEWVCPLDKDIEEVFNPDLNANFNKKISKILFFVFMYVFSNYF